MPDPAPAPEQAEQKEAPNSPPQTTPPAAPATGRRAAFQDLKLQLTPEELANPGTQKCILDMLIRAEQERDDLKEYLSKYYDADKRAEVLAEKLETNRINETLFGVGVAIGGTIIGLAPFLFEKGLTYGYITLGVGIVLTLGATIGRIKFK
jgi:hypothetical protein